MKRRHLLQSIGVLALEPLLFGCQSKSDQIRIQFLKGSLPALLTGEFRKQFKIDAEFGLVSQLANSMELLTKWQQPLPAVPPRSVPWQSPLSIQSSSLITLGDAWLGTAIERQLIKPLNISQLSTWQRLDPKWQQLVTKDSQIWGAPYRWGSTVLVYRRDRLTQNGIPLLTDWTDLWRPQLKGRISLLNQRQEVIGLTLKHLGYSYNTDPLAVRELPVQLRRLHQQVKLYSSDNYISPLLTGDTWVALAWSNDVSKLVDRIPNLGMVVPKSGTSLWADLWVQPQKDLGKDRQREIEKWIDFCWQPTVADKISSFTTGLSPVVSRQMQAQPVPAASANASANVAVFSKGEFLLPLSSERQKSYQALWLAMQSSGEAPTN